jgi:hypothetical protein
VEVELIGFFHALSAPTKHARESLKGIGSSRAGFTHEQDVPAWLNLHLFEATEAVKVDA